MLHLSCTTLIAGFGPPPNRPGECALCPAAQSLDAANQFHLPVIKAKIALARNHLVAVRVRGLPYRSQEACSVMYVQYRGMYCTSDWAGCSRRLPNKLLPLLTSETGEWRSGSGAMPTRCLRRAVPHACRRLSGLFSEIWPTHSNTKPMGLGYVINLGKMGTVCTCVTQMRICQRHRAWYVRYSTEVSPASWWTLNSSSCRASYEIKVSRI